MKITPNFIKDIIKNSCDIGDTTNEEYPLEKVIEYKSPVRYYRTINLKDLPNSSGIYRLGNSSSGRSFWYCDILISIKSKSSFYLRCNEVRISDKTNYFKPQDPLLIRALVFSHFDIEFTEDEPADIEIEGICTPTELDRLLCTHSSKKVKFKMDDRTKYYICFGSLCILNLS